MPNSGRPRAGRPQQTGRLQTTPGHFDYPPATDRPASHQTNPSIDGRNHLPLPQAPRQSRRSTAEPLPLTPPIHTSNDRDMNSPWIPSSPEARARMQRVLRQVHEQQEREENSRHDHGRRLHENDYNIRARVDRLRERQHTLIATGRRITEVEDRMRGLDNVPSATYSASSHEIHPSSSQASSSASQNHSVVDNSVPVQSALRDASERLRLVNDELRHLLDQPIEGPETEAEQELRREYTSTQSLPGLPGATPGTLFSVDTADEPWHGGFGDDLHLIADELGYDRLPLGPDDSDLNQATQLHANNHDGITREPSQLSDAWRAVDGDTESSGRRTRPRVRLDDGDGECSRQKRRRLDDGPTPDHLPLIQYGYEGQVVSGKLKLELVSSDGGILEPLAPFKTCYGAENVLKDDTSVYCTRSQRCNMIFQHPHQAAFCLERLVIRAPKTGFTDPVQEGLVFVSLRNDEVFDRTARYQIYYFPTSRFASYFASSRDSDPAGPILEIEHAVLHPIASRPRLLDQDDLQLHLPANRLHNTDPVRNDGPGRDSDSFSEATSEDDANWSSEYYISRMQEHYRETEPMRASRNTAQSILEQRVFDNYHSRGAAARQRRQGRHLHASSHGSNSGFLKPAARFSIRSRQESDSTMYGVDEYTACEQSDTITIKFDPPISCKFLLLKMWSPRHGGNIDVQSIIAYGFAGPRSFPSIEKR